jgi:hypothetical protein
MQRFAIYAAWLLLIFIATTQMVTWTTDYWWFNSLGQGATYLRIMAWRGGGFVVGAMLFALVFGQNVRLALSYLHSHTMDYVLLGSGINRFGGPSLETIKNASTYLICAASLIAGATVASRFDLWVALFYGAIDTGQIDIISERDISFFLFIFPALSWIWSFFGVIIFLSFCYCAGLYLWSELIETGPQILHVSQRVANHLAYLSALILIWQGIRLGLQIVSAPVMLGGSYSEIFGPADQHFKIPTLFFFLLTSFPLAYLVSRYAYENYSALNRKIPIGIIASLWLGLSFILPTVAAPFGRSISSDTEKRAAISRHLESARNAWQINNIPTRGIEPPNGDWIASVPPTVSTSATATTQSPIANKDLWPVETLRQSLNKSESLNVSSGHGIAKVHTVSVKDGVIYRAVAYHPNKPAEATLLEVTTSIGPPKIINRQRIGSLLLVENHQVLPRDSFTNIPPTPEETFALPPSYRRSEHLEFSIPQNHFLTSVLFAWRFHDLSLLKSGQNITWYADPIERAKALLPFINFGDTEAVPELINGTLYWNVAGFSVSRFYPDSVSLQMNPAWRNVNYLRQSTAVIIDGATGATHAVQLSPSEPFSRVWKRAFPQAFTQFKELPLPTASRKAIEASIQPAASLVEANAQILTRYHPNSKADEDISLFGDRSKQWRIWDSLQPRGFQQSGNWLSAYTPTQSIALDGALTTTINSFFRISPQDFASDPQLNWQELRPSTPIALSSKLATLSTGQARNPMQPMQFCLQLITPKESKGESRLVLLRSTANRTKGGNWSLEIESESKGEVDSRTLSAAENLARSAKLWRDWKQAFKDGNWAVVQEKEKQLESIFSKF